MNEAGWRAATSKIWWLDVSGWSWVWLLKCHLKADGLAAFSSLALAKKKKKKCQGQSRLSWRIPRWSQCFPKQLKNPPKPAKTQGLYTGFTALGNVLSIVLITQLCTSIVWVGQLPCWLGGIRWSDWSVACSYSTLDTLDHPALVVTWFSHFKFCFNSGTFFSWTSVHPVSLVLSINFHFLNH